VDKNGNLKNGVGIDVDQFDLVVMKKATEKFTGGKTDPPLEEGHQHYNIVGMRGGNFFILHRSPLGHDVVREKVFFHELEKLLLIDEGRLELLRV
jgi:hypothetical protein